MRFYYILLVLIPAGILAQNKVGINTDTPEYNLDVRGTNDTSDGGELQLATPSQTNFLRFFGGRLGDHNPFVAFHDDDTMHFVTTLPDWSTYTRRMSILPTGNVGIGTDLPLSKLDIQAIGDGAELLRFTTDRPWVWKQSGGGSSTRLTLQSTVDSKWLEITSPSGLNRAAEFLASDTYSQVLLARDAGEAGVGVSDPAGKFHILTNSTSSWPQLRLTESESDYTRIKMESSTHPGAFWDIAGRADTLTSGAKLNFYFANGTNNGDRMTITGIGNVGIGTTNPAEKLHVVGTMRVSDLAGTGDRNVIVDGNGKFKIGTTGQGDTDWLETSTQVSTLKEVYIDSDSGPTSSVTVVGKASNGNNFSSLSLYNEAYLGGTYRRLLFDANDIDAFRGTGVDPIHESLSVQRLSSGNLNLVHGGGMVGIGVTPTSKLTVEGADNNGTVAALEIRSAGNGQKMLMDGNEIDVTGTANALHFNANSGHPVTIGTLTVASGYKLSVKGKIMAEEVRVQLYANWPDYVFNEDYKLTPLGQLSQQIKDAGHLPGIPSAAEIEEHGLHLGDMQRKMMEKIEELTLHMISLHERIETLENENAALKSLVEK